MGLATREHLYVSLVSWSVVLVAACACAVVLLRLLGADVHGIFP